MDERERYRNRDRDYYDDEPYGYIDMGPEEDEHIRYGTSRNPRRGGYTRDMGGGYYSGDFGSDGDFSSEEDYSTRRTPYSVKQRYGGSSQGYGGSRYGRGSQEYSQGRYQGGFGGGSGGYSRIDRPRRYESDEDFDEYDDYTDDWTDDYARR